MTVAPCAAVFLGPDQPLELHESAPPIAGRGEVVVEIIGCTLCGSDVHSRLGRRQVATPTILGHEILGRIVGFGEQTPPVDFTGQRLAIGDRVTWAIVASCGGCHFCKRSLPQKCLRAFKYGHEVLRAERSWSGGLASHCLLAPGTAIFKIAAALDDATVLPTNCATATTAAAIRASGHVRDRVVLVMGAGMLGLTACAMASASGAAKVICCELQASRRERAIAFGATDVVTPAELSAAVRGHSQGHGADIVLEMTGALPAMEGSLEVLATGGVFVEVGAVFPVAELRLRPEDLVRKHWTLGGIHNYAPRDLATALTFLEQAGDFPFSSLVSASFELRDVNAAFDAAASGQHLRVSVS